MLAMFSSNLSSNERDIYFMRNILERERDSQLNFNMYNKDFWFRKNQFKKHNLKDCSGF